MGDWKSDIERRVRERQEAEARREAERVQEERRKIQEASEREYARRLTEHQRRFKCHICGVPSGGPTRNKETYGMEDQYSEWVDHWDSPEDLSKCSVCDKWACNTHRWSSGYPDFESICERCAKAGYLPGGKRQ